MNFDDDYSVFNGYSRKRINARNWATEEEAEYQREREIVEAFERWLEMPCLDFPAREGFDF